MASTIFWPQGLPDGQVLRLPLREGYSYRARSPVLTTDFGLVTRARRIYSDAPADIQLGWTFSASEWAYFEAWFHHELDFGTQWFWLPVKAAGTLELREVNFHGEMPAYGLRGVTGCNVTGAVSTRKGTAVAAETWEVIRLYGSIDAYQQALLALELFVNQDGLALLE